jgi:hypothetical protein
MGLDSPPLTSRRHVLPENDIQESDPEDGGSIILNGLPENDIQESDPEDGGSIILNFEDLSASVESLACGMCGNIQLLAAKKTIGLATRFTITCRY